MAAQGCYQAEIVEQGRMEVERKPPHPGDQPRDQVKATVNRLACEFATSALLDRGQVEVENRQDLADLIVQFTRDAPRLFLAHQDQLVRQRLELAAAAQDIFEQLRVRQGQGDDPADFLCDLGLRSAETRRAGAAKQEDSEHPVVMTQGDSHESVYSRGMKLPGHDRQLRASFEQENDRTETRGAGLECHAQVTDLELVCQLR